MTTTPDPIDVEVGARIRAFRKALGISQARLADEIGVTFQQVQKYERGINRVSASMLVRIAMVIGVPPGELLGQRGDGAPQRVEVFRNLGVAGALELVDGYARIEDSEVRKALVLLVNALANKPRPG